MKHRAQRTGLIIRLMRIADGVRPERLARGLGVSADYLGDVESGKREADMAFLRGVAERFNVPLALLLLGEDIRSDDAVMNLLRDTFLKVLATRAAEREASKRGVRRLRYRKLCATCPVEQALRRRLAGP